MANDNIETVYFNDGCIKSKDKLYISSKLHSLDPDEVDFARMTFYFNKNWTKHDLNWRVESVCYSDSLDACCALSVNGEVNFATTSGFHVEKIPEAGSYDGLASVNQIREIGKHLYVCGDQGQVYKREESGWIKFDDGLRDENISASALCLNSIDGTGDKDIYVVGDKGRIFHYDGIDWTEVDSPTNKHLERVRCISPKELYICGKDGLFLKGSKSTFLDFSLKSLEEYFWGMEKFEDKVYLATLKQLYVFDGKQITPLKTGLSPEIGGYRLQARDGVLWSFGVDDLAFFDGNKWSRALHPDNPPPQ